MSRMKSIYSTYKSGRIQPFKTYYIQGSLFSDAPMLFSNGVSLVYTITQSIARKPHLRQQILMFSNQIFPGVDESFINPP